MHTRPTALAPLTIPDQQGIEVARGDRFEFGRNWARFLSLLDEDRIRSAERGLQQMLELDRLDGLRFLDIGSGSGLSSLAAKRLGAYVHSFDYDPESVACTSELRRRYFPSDAQWVVEQGSVLNEDYVRALGAFDIVYSWGVLHHTGHMWRALDHAAIPLVRNGKLWVAIYNDTGTQSRRWLRIKRIYNALPRAAQRPFAATAAFPRELKAMTAAVVRRRPGDYIRSWTDYGEHRGMNKWHDIVDWVGGYPYEFATPDEIFDFYRRRGFTLTKLKCGGAGLGCNEFVFVRLV